MTLSAEERERLADVVRLQPTKNGELQERWGLADGSEVHEYLESHLGDYYYRNEDSYICATPEAAELTGAKPGFEGGGGADGPQVIRVPELEAQVFEVVAGPDDRSESVVSVLQRVREAFDADPDVDAVREALQSLRRKGAVVVVSRAVPTFKLAVARDEIEVEVVR